MTEYKLVLEYRLVPVEPTPEMLDAGVQAQVEAFAAAKDSSRVVDARHGMTTAAYRAMLAAAPADPAPESVEDIMALADEWLHPHTPAEKRAALRAAVERLVWTQSQLAEELIATREAGNRLLERAERAEREMAEQRQVMLGVGPITCRNGIVHEREDGCLYCRAERAEREKDVAESFHRVAVKERDYARRQGDEALALLKDLRDSPEIERTSHWQQIDALTRRKG